MTIAAKLYQDARWGERQAVELDGTIRGADWRPIDVAIDELSVSGFRMAMAAELPIGSTASLGLPGAGMRQVRIVRRAGVQYGCEFETPLSFMEFDAALSTDTVITPPEWLAAPRTNKIVDEKYSPRTRLAVIFGAAGLLWAAIIAVAIAL